MEKSNKNISFLIKTVKNGLFQLLLFTFIPLLFYIVSNRTIVEFHKYIGFYLPSSILSFVIVIVTMIIITAILNMLKGILFSKNSIEEYDDECISTMFREEGLKFTTIIGLLFTAIITTGLSEEILFRGFIAKGLIGNLGFFYGNIIQAMIFSLIHAIPLYLSSKKASISLFEFVRVFVLAYAFGWLMVFVCGGSILPLWVKHGSGNAIGMYRKAFKTNNHESSN